MSSPSSSGSGKRKRNSTLESMIKQSSTADLLQPSSRDASGEDAADSASQEVTSNRHKKSAVHADPVNPPAKRPRTRSNAAAPASSGSNGTIVDDEEDGPNEGNGVRLRRRTKSSSTKEQVEGQDEDSKAMPPPVKGGLQDPVAITQIRRLQADLCESTPTECSIFSIWGMTGVCQPQRCGLLK